MIRQSYIWDNLHRYNFAVPWRFRCTCPDPTEHRNGDKMGRGNLSYLRGEMNWMKRGITYPVATTRLLRTRIAPTLLFIQFERRDANEARC